MKITSRMKYQETAETRELELYTENTYHIYIRMYKPVIDNLIKHYNKGEYSHEKALESVLNLTTWAAKEYTREYGNGRNIFTTSDRYTAAVNILQYIEDEYINRV